MGILAFVRLRKKGWLAYLKGFFVVDSILQLCAHREVANFL